MALNAAGLALEKLQALSRLGGESTHLASFATVVRAESELSVLARQCLDRHFPDIPAVREEVEAWQRRRNAERATITWRFTATDARTKL